jgi:RNA polymerase sigma-70 factor (ECF subfamily)
MTQPMMDLATLYGSHARDVYRFAFYLAGNRAEAEDIVSETFLRVWTARDDLRLATVRSFLFAIARNVFLHGLRREARRAVLSSNLRDPTPDPATVAEHRDELSTVLRGLQDLAEVDRSALLMRVCGDVPYREIAAALGISEASAKVKVHRARSKLARFRRTKEEL